MAVVELRSGEYVVCAEGRRWMVVRPLQDGRVLLRGGGGELSAKDPAELCGA